MYGNNTEGMIKRHADQSKKVKERYKSPEIQQVFFRYDNYKYYNPVALCVQFWWPCGINIVSTSESIFFILMKQLYGFHHMYIESRQRSFYLKSI